MSDTWASDVPISRPEPIPTDRPVVVDWGGLAFNANGLVHNLTEGDIERQFLPHWTPDGGAVDGA